MNAGPLLAEMARQVRGDTIMILQAASDRELLWTPPGIANHILWHAGHAVWLGDVLCLAPLTGASGLSADWASIFGSDCVPPSTRKHWPPREEVADRLSAQLEVMLDSFAQHQARLVDAGPITATGWRLLPGIIHAFHDEARHQGQMYGLLKMQRAKC